MLDKIMLFYYVSVPTALVLIAWGLARYFKKSTEGAEPQALPWMRVDKLLVNHELTAVDGSTAILDTVDLNDTLTVGSDGVGHDVTFYGDTEGSYFLYDADTCTLTLPGTSSKSTLGGFDSLVASLGSVLSADNTASFRVYTTDGNAAIGSGSFVRSILGRNLQTYTSGNREQEAAGVVGQIVSVAGTNRHNMAGVWGSYEAKTSLTVGGQAAATDTWAQAAILARVGVGTAITTIAANAVLAGVAAMSNTVSFAANSGVYAAFYAGAWASAIDWAYGLYLEGGKFTTGVAIGACTTGVSITGATTNAISITGTPTNSDILLHYGATIMNGAAGTLTITEAAIELVGAIKLDGTVTFDGDGTIADTADLMTLTQGTITLAGATAINLDGDVTLTGALALDGAGDITMRNGATIVNTSGILTVTEDAIVLVGGGHGKIQFGGATDWGTGATGTDIDGDGWDWVTSTVGHLDSGVLATAVAAGYHAMTVTVNQTTATSVFGTWTELYIGSGLDLGGSNNYAAVWGQVELLGSVTSPDTGNFMAAGYFNFIAPTTFTVATGVKVAGVLAQLEAGTITKGGTARVSAFEASATSTEWDYGLFIPTATAGVGLGIGTDAAPFALTAAATKAVDIYVTTAVTGDVDLNALYIEYNRSASTAADGRDWGLKVRMDAGNYRYNTMTGIYSTIEIGSGGTLGRGSAVQGELILDDVATSSGAYSAIDAEITYTGSSSNGLPGPVSFMSCILSGTETNFCDNAYLFEIDGGSAATDHLISANAQTARCIIGEYGSGAVRYMVLSQAQDCLSLTTTATPIVLAAGGAMTTGIGVSGIGSGADARAIKSQLTVASPAHGDGYAVNEFEVSPSGENADAFSCLGAWVNVGSGVVLGSGLKTSAANTGIWSSGATLTGAHIIFGMRMQADLSSGGFNRLCPFSLNTGTTAITALFDVGSPGTEVSWTAGSGGMTNQLGSVPFMVDNNGTIYYIKLYDVVAA